MSFTCFFKSRHRNIHHSKLFKKISTKTLPALSHAILIFLFHDHILFSVCVHRLLRPQRPHSVHRSSRGHSGVRGEDVHPHCVGDCKGQYADQVWDWIGMYGSRFLLFIFFLFLFSFSFSFLSLFFS